VVQGNRKLSIMRSRLILIISALAIVAASCSSGSDAQTLSDAELVWCSQVDDTTVFTAIWDAADELEVQSVGAFLLDKAGITTDVDPKVLSAEDLSAEELEALSSVGENFDSSDLLWIEYINTPDGSKACFAGYTNVNG
jgi:ABC-type glycerol-3-phosphate transport system substrate-binding protein